MTLPPEAVPPGCGEVLGKVHLINHGGYGPRITAYI